MILAGGAFTLGLLCGWLAAALVGCCADAARDDVDARGDLHARGGESL